MIREKSNGLIVGMGSSGAEEKAEADMVRQAKTEDLVIVAGLAVQMWKEPSMQELIEEFSEIMLKNDGVFFLKYDKEQPVGFAQCQLRHDYVEGTDSTPVGYLEGIFVHEEFRRKGYAEELLKECEKWAKAKGCTEFASDCELGNDNSLQFHLAEGFTEANRVICFRKEL